MNCYRLILTLEKGSAENKFVPILELHYPNNSPSSISIRLNEYANLKIVDSGNELLAKHWYFFSFALCFRQNDSRKLSVSTLIANLKTELPVLIHFPGVIKY